MRKNRWNRRLAILLALLLMGMLGGCAAPGNNAGQTTEASAERDETAEPTEGETAMPTGDGAVKPTEGENGLIFTQTENVGVCTDTDDRDYRNFEEFMAAAETFALTPGFKEMMVSQGMDQHSETGNIYISGYFKRDQDNPFDSDNPSVIAVLNADGELTAEYVVYDTDGTAFASHMGGVAVGNDAIYVSGSQQKAADGTTTYWIAEILLEGLPTEGHHEVKVNQLYQVPVQPSFMNYSNGILWIGNFYLEGNDSYQAPATVGTIKADNDRAEFGSYILGYDLSEQGSARMQAAEGEMVMPDADKVYAMTDRIQGMTMLPDGRIVLSRSYGRKNNSQLMVYDPEKADTKTVSINGTEYTCMILEEETCQTEFYTMMPMSEGITVKTDGNGLEVLILYESGAVLYSGDGTYDRNAGVFRTDYVWKITLPQK